MGEVYKARDTRLDRTVAIKVLPPELSADPERRARFQREARTVAGLSHPHICTLFDVGEHDGTAFIVMELLEGEPLRARLCEARAAVPAMVDTAIQLADALEAAHAKGIVHRDIKPENIFITTRGTAKLLDFGIAKLVAEQAATSAALTTTRVGTGPVALGTVAYMSPEQVRGEPLDARTDLFSLGVVLYEMATGTAPFHGATSGALLAEILTKAPTAPVRLNPDVPADLERLVNRLLEKDRALRCQSAADLRAELEHLKRALANPVVATPSERASIVVLPFENLSPDPDNAFFADGLTEEVISDLSKIRALRVISRTSAMMFKNARKSAPAIAQELNVRHVLEGSVRRAGNHLRITAQLIDAATDTHLWAEKYAGTLDDVFDLQEQLSRRIAEALKGKLTPDEDRRLASHEIPDVEAYALYLRARQEFLKITVESMHLAEHLVEQALARTGPNALLLAMSAEIEIARHDMGISPTAATLDRADALTAQALELNPGLSEAHVARGLLAIRRFDVAASVRHVLKAVELDPGSAMAAWAAGYALAMVGRTGEAREHGDRAHALDPLWWPAPFGSLSCGPLRGPLRLRARQNGRDTHRQWGQSCCRPVAGGVPPLRRPLRRSSRAARPGSCSRLRQLLFDRGLPRGHGERGQGGHARGAGRPWDARGPRDRQGILLDDRSGSCECRRRGRSTGLAVTRDRYGVHRSPFLRRARPVLRHLARRSALRCPDGSGAGEAARLRGVTAVLRRSTNRRRTSAGSTR